jgi:hypothetical protein
MRCIKDPRQNYPMLNFILKNLKKEEKKHRLKANQFTLE